MKIFQAYYDELDIRLRTGVAEDDHMTRIGGNRLGIIDRATKTIKDLLKNTCYNIIQQNGLNGMEK